MRDDEPKGGLSMHLRSPLSLRLRRAVRGAAMVATALVVFLCVTAQAQEKKPNILVIFGDDSGQSNISAYTFGLMGYKTPNIDRLAKEGMLFTDYYAEQSCTAGRLRNC
jgi:hypothetical protein